MKAIFGCSLEVVNVGCCDFGCSGNWMLWSWMLWYSFSFGCCGFGCYGFGWYDGRCEYSLWRRFWMFFGGYERWMLRFWMLRKLDATLLDASILTRCEHMISSQGRHFVLFWGCTCTPNVKFCNPNDDFAPSRARNLGKHRQGMSPICDNCMASLRLFGKFWKKILLNCASTRALSNMLKWLSHLNISFELR